MEATFVNYRRARHHQNLKQAILKVADSSEEAQKSVGKMASWTSSTGTVISGKITALHGRTGSVRAHFTEKGLPGQALGKKVKVE